MDNLLSMFRVWAQLDKPPIVQLLNKDRVIVAALYLNELNANELTICQPGLGINEKYFLYLNGFGIYFTYFEKINRN